MREATPEDLRKSQKNPDHHVLAALPTLNKASRMGEREADAYFLEHVGLPHALAGALIKTAEYGYPLAGPLREALFYTHPMGANRVQTAMEWKVENGQRPQED